MSGRYSHSMLALYRLCPLRYALHYEHHLEPIQSPSRHDLDFGNAWDAGLTAWYRDGDSGKALDAFAATYPRNRYPAELPFNSQGKTFDNGLQGLADYITRWQEEDAHWTVLHIQERMTNEADDRTLKLDMIIRDSRDGQIYGVDSKAQPLNSNVLTPEGWLPMGRLRVGDQVIGADGFPCQVLKIYPRETLPCFEVTFSDGSKTRCSEDHLWTGWFSHSGHGKTVTWTLKKIREHIERNAAYRFRIPLVQPVQFPSRPLPLHPYLLGSLLGDGYIASHSPQISVGDFDEVEVVGMIRDCIPEGITLTKSPSRGNFSWTLSGGRAGKRDSNVVMRALKDLNLKGTKSATKFIPEEYLLSNIQQRTALLQGLLDTDGCCYDGHIYFDSISPQMSNDVVWLVRSLGGQAKRRERPQQHAYRVDIRFDNDIIPFRLNRKLAKRRPIERLHGKNIVSIMRVEDAEMQCIKVSALDGLYVTDDFIVTHNSTGSYLDGKYWSRYEPNSQVRMYTDHIKERFGDCGGFVINAASFKHRSKAYTPRSGPDKGVQQPAGDWHSFARMIFNPNENALALERDSAAYWVARIEADQAAGVWGYNDQSCHAYGRECEYYKLCSAGYSWPQDEELVLNYYRQQCPKVLDAGRCQLALSHAGDHDAAIAVQTDNPVETDEEIEEAVV